MKMIDKLRKLAGLPCRQCGGRGYVIDSDVAAFIERNGLAALQAADTLMMNEIDYGALGSIPVDTWQEVGLSEDEAELFATDVGHVHKIHACRVCKGQEDHPSPLKAATDVINALRANDRRRRDKWAASLTPEQHKAWRIKRRLARMDIAIRYAAQEPHCFKNETAE